MQLNAIIDTGATCSAISKKAADLSGAVKRGTSSILSVHNTTTVTKYSANLTLPNEICFNDIKLVEINSLGSFDVLIGTDILSKGNFAVSSKDGNMWFSFKTPPDGNLILL